MFDPILICDNEYIVKIFSSINLERLVIDTKYKKRKLNSLKQFSQKNQRL